MPDAPEEPFPCHLVTLEDIFQPVPERQVRKRDDCRYLRLVRSR